MAPGGIIRRAAGRLDGRLRRNTAGDGVRGPPPRQADSCMPRVAESRKPAGISMPGGSPYRPTDTFKLQGGRGDPELGKDRPKRLVHASEPAYKQLVRSLYVSLSACASLPQGANASYDARGTAMCILQGASLPCPATSPAHSAQKRPSPPGTSILVPLPALLPRHVRATAEIRPLQTHLTSPSPMPWDIAIRNVR